MTTPQLLAQLTGPPRARGPAGILISTLFWPSRLKMDPFGRRFDGDTPFIIWSSTGTSGDLNVTPLTVNTGFGIFWAGASITAFSPSHTENAHSIKYNI